MKSLSAMLYDRSVVNLKDEYVIDLPVGTLFLPSSAVCSQNGNYYLEDVMGFLQDHDVFPALVLPESSSTFVKILTPTGIHTIGKFALVSRLR